MLLLLVLLASSIMMLFISCIAMILCMCSILMGLTALRCYGRGLVQQLVESGKLNEAVVDLHSVSAVQK